MKKALLAAMMLGTIPAFAQTIERPNLVKTNITAFAFRNFGLHYERILDKRFSVGIIGSTLAKGSIPYASTFNINGDFQNMKFGGTTVTIEPRYYVGRGYGEGFYIAPYYRYSRYKVSDFVYNVDYNKETIPVALSGKVTAHSGGVMLGAQWFLGKKDNIVLDAYFIGAHYGASRGDITGKTTKTLTPAEQQEIKRELDGQSLPVVKYSTSVNANSANMKIDGPWAGLRFGLSLGYRF